MNELTLIYHFQASQNVDEEFLPASYKMVYFFNGQGMIESSFILEVLKAFPDSNYKEKTFLSLDDLKAFALRVCQELQEPVIRLISVQDFNVGVDGAKDLDSFRDMFNKYGETLINETHPKRKGIFGKFFGQ